MNQNSNTNGLEGMLKKSFPDDDRTLSDRDINKEKQELISLLKNYKKEDIIPKPERNTLWKRIRKVMDF